MITFITYDEKENTLQTEKVDMRDFSFLVKNKYPISRTFSVFNPYDVLKPDTKEVKYFPVKLEKKKNIKVRRGDRIKRITKTTGSAYIWLSENAFTPDREDILPYIIEEINSMGGDYKLWISFRNYKGLKRKYK